MKNAIAVGKEKRFCLIALDYHKRCQANERLSECYGELFAFLDRDLNVYFKKKFFIRKRASKTQNLKEMFRKSVASNSRAAVFKKADW